MTRRALVLFIGATVAIGATAGVAAHAVATGIYQIRHKKAASAPPEGPVRPLSGDTKPSTEK